MNTLVYQCWVGPTEPWVDISVTKFKQYANAHGSDYIFNTTSPYKVPHFDHLRLIHDHTFEKYDRILYVDVDIIPENFEENIFDEEIKDVGAVPEHELPGMVRTPGFMMARSEKAYRVAAEIFDIPVVKPVTVAAPFLMFNSGMILWSKEGRAKAKEKFLHWTKWYKSTEGQMALDQSYVSGQIIKHLDYTEMDVRWNCLPRMRFNDGFVPPNINFVHYTGGKKSLIKDLYK